jgi:hypothetical protein
MAELAATGLAQPLGGELAGRVDHDATGSQPSRFLNLVARRPIGVEAKSEQMTDH